MSPKKLSRNSYRNRYTRKLSKLKKARSFPLLIASVCVLAAVGFAISVQSRNAGGLQKGEPTNPVTPQLNAEQAKDSRTDSAGSTSNRSFAKSRAIANLMAPIVTASKTDALLTDVDTDGKADPGDTLKYTVVIGASGENATGVNFTDTVDPNTTFVGGSLAASPVAVNDTFPVTVAGNVRINSANLAAPFSVVSNDFLGVNPTSTISAFDATTANGGQVVMTTSGADIGKFTYNPPAGFEGVDTFTYTLTDNPNVTTAASNRTATVSITVSGMIWFINNNAASCVAAGCGRLTNPFSTLAAFAALNNGAGNNPAANDNIFVYESATAYVGPLTLLAGQKFIGQDATDTLANISGVNPPTGSDPLPATSPGAPIVNITGNGITVATNNTLRGFTGGNATSDIDGSAFGTLNISDVTLNGTGRALSLATGTLNATFGSISSTDSTTTGISLTGVGGTLTSGSTTVTNSTGIGIDVGTSSASLNFANTSSTLSGNTGIQLLTNTGAITFGSLTITPDPGQRGLLATDNSQTITATSGSVSTSNAIAVQITRGTGTTPLAVSLTSVSATGGTNGIVLTNTSGSFAIAGNSAGVCGGSVGTGPPASPGAPTAPNIADCTGGTIQSTTGAGIALSNTTNVSLTRVRVTGGGDDGIRGTNVTNFTLASSLIESNGNATGEANIDFGDVNDTTPDGLFGTASITSSTIRNAFEHNASIRNQNGTLSITVTDSQFTNISANTQSSDGLVFDEVQTANVTINVQDCYFAANRADHFQASGSNSAVLNVTFKNNTLTGGHTTALGQGITINAATGVAFGGYTGRIDYDVDGNNIQAAVSNAIITNLGTSGPAGVFDGFIRNNIIGNAGVALSCSSQANGIEVDAHGNGTHNVSVTSNTLRRCFDRGILVLANDGNGFLNMTVTGNSINTLTDTNAPTGTPREAFNMVAGATSTNVFGQIDSHAVCLNLTSTSGNMVGGAFKNGDIRVRQRFRTSVALPGYTPPGGNHFNTATVITFLEGNNPGATATATTDGDQAGVTTEGYFGSAGCTAPSLMETSLAAVKTGAVTTASTAVLRAATTAPAPTPTEAFQPSWWTRTLMAAANFTNGVLSLVEPTAHASDSSPTHPSTTAVTGNLERPETPLRSASGFGNQKSAVKNSDSMRSKKIVSHHAVRNTRASAPMFAGETVTINIGTLRAGDSVTITFQVTVNNPPNLAGVPPATPKVTNQGTVSGSNFSNVLTDDPAVGGASDPTDTPVDLFDTTTTLASNLNPSNTGDQVTFTATVAENPAQGSVDPTGTVDFIDTSNGNAVICNDVPLSAGSAQCQTSALTAGLHNIRADYSGDGNFDPSQSNVVGQTVNACTPNPIVTSTADSGAGTLREAVTSVCSGTTITFNLSGAGPHTITLTTGELAVTKNVTINNNSGESITVSGNNASRVFNINSGKTASIIGLTLTGGSATNGGAVINDGTLTIVNSTLSANTATADGGAISTTATGTALTLINTTISGNNANGNGGGVVVLGGTMTSINSTITNNFADNDNNATGTGGGIAASAGTTTL